MTAVCHSSTVFSSLDAPPITLLRQKSEGFCHFRRCPLCSVPSNVFQPYLFRTHVSFPSFSSNLICTPAVLFTSRNLSSQFRFASDMGGSFSSSSAGSIHEFTVKDAKGNDADLSTYRGKVLLIVNVASQCGLTNSNYTELGQLYEKYKNTGFEILAFPCNQFGGHEPGTNDQIVEFACTRFKAEYPIFDNLTLCYVDVNGKNTAVYKFLKSSKGSLFGDNIKWNFEKFLVDKEGHVVDRYAPTTSPLSLEKDIKKLLGLL